MQVFGGDEHERSVFSNDVPDKCNTCVTKFTKVLRAMFGVISVAGFYSSSFPQSRHPSPEFPAQNLTPIWPSKVKHHLKMRPINYCSHICIIGGIVVVV
ncbi:hypothetical protein WG66_013618, partial [Moniliophthora roreri]